MSIRRRSRLHSWALPAFLLVTVLFSLSLISAEHRSEAAALAAPLAWVSQRLTPERRTQRQLTSARPTAEVPEEQPEPQQPALQQGQTQKQPQEQQQHSDHTQGQGKPAPAQHPQDWKALHSTLQCHEPEFGAPEQRVCVFENLVLYNGQVIYVQPDPNDSVPPIKIAWLKKFEGDDFFHPTVVNQSHLGFSWDTAQVEELPRVGLFHQQHYSNFYHMFSEVAPTIHYLMCKYLGDCFYSRDSKTQLVWIQEKRPDIPPYIMLDTVVDTFKCLTPRPVWHKDDAHLHNKVFVLRKAVVGVGGEVRVFHEWGERLKHFREPPKAPMVAWRQRMADCFGYGFTQAVAPTDPLRVLFINRHYREGRMILNQAELAHEIERVPEAKAFPSVEVKLHNLNGDDKLLDQAALFWNASLLIWPHGATMALTALLPRGAQAIEVIPWVEEDKARQAEWVQAIRHSFSLDIGLHMVQNKDRRRYMFNQDMLAGYQQYRDASPEQKVALLERGECPPGIDPFICPIWWNHWQASVNLDWATLEPAVKAALAQLAKLRRAGGIRPASQAAQPEAAAGTASAEAAAAAGAAAGEVAGGAALQQQGSNATAEAQAAR